MKVLRTMRNKKRKRRRSKNRKFLAALWRRGKCIRVELIGVYRGMILLILSIMMMWENRVENTISAQHGLESIYCNIKPGIMRFKVLRLENRVALGNLKIITRKLINMILKNKVATGCLLIKLIMRRKFRIKQRRKKFN